MPPIIKSWSSSLSQLSIGNQRSCRNVLGVVNEKCWHIPIINVTMNSMSGKGSVGMPVSRTINALCMVIKVRCLWK